MGYISDIVIAGSEELSSVLDTENPTSQWHGIADFSAVDTLPLVRLYCLMTDRKGDDAFDEAEDWLMTQYEESADGAWAFSFPPELTSLLASVSSKSQASLVQAWFESDEVQELAWSLDKTKSILDELSRLAERAIREKQSIVWRTGL